MKRIILFTTTIVLLLLAFLFLKNGKHIKDPNFVSLENGAFSLQGKPFYPVAINYVGAMRTDGNDYWPSPMPEYGPNADAGILFDKDSSLKILQADLEMMKQMGFNTVRFTHLCEIKPEPGPFDLYYIKTYAKDEKDSKLILKDGVTYIKYLKAIDKLIELSKNAGLKVILLVKMYEEDRSSYEFLKNLMTHFENEPTILAYDFFNEPMYFHRAERSKKDIQKITTHWQNFLHQYAPNQLSTIGLTGAREVFRWDPNMLAMDFISFHPYEYEPNQVMNEIYWYGNNVKKPWIIGETSIPANNDSIKYSEQNKFAEQTLKQVCDCGGVGYSWWQYKDVKWGSYHSDYMGIVTWEGFTQNNKGHFIFGKVKPLENVFLSYSPVKNKSACFKFDNYYNFSNYKDHRIYGTIVDENDKPIEGAVILGWDDRWDRTVSTFSKKDGTFELFSNFQFENWIASAVDYSMVRDGFWHENDRKYDSLTHVTNYELGKLKLKKINWYKN